MSTQTTCARLPFSRMVVTSSVSKGYLRRMIRAVDMQAHRANAWADALLEDSESLNLNEQLGQSES